MRSRGSPTGFKLKTNTKSIGCEDVTDVFAEQKTKKKKTFRHIEAFVIATFKFKTLNHLLLTCYYIFTNYYFVKFVIITG